MRPLSAFDKDPLDYAKAPTEGGSARVSEAVTRAIRARKGDAPTRPRDPAPSRAAYRMNRLWLTPSFRFFMRRVAPVLGVAALVTLWFTPEDNRRVFTEAVDEFKREIQSRPEFMVSLMAIDGASDELSTDIREVASIEFPISSFDLDLPILLDQIEGLDAVEEAGLRVRAGGILQVDITERQPAVVWRSEHGLEVLDAEGHRVGALNSRMERSELPLIAGEGADRHVGEALKLISMSGPFADRLRGIVRIGERRWDLVLDRDQIIRLPEHEPIGALAQVIALDQAKDLLGRDLVIVDMREPSRPTLQLSEPAQDEMRRIRSIEFGVPVR